MNWQHESAEHLSLRHTSLAHHVGDALALPQEGWIVTLRATDRGPECGQIRYPDPKTSPLHEIGASPQRGLKRFAAFGLRSI